MRISVGLVALLILLCGVSAVSGGEQSPFMPIGAVTNAPNGWIGFCAEYKPECETHPSMPRSIMLTPETRADILKINEWVNENIYPLSDFEHWGVVEQWNYPDDGYGDCEDYALLKRRMLMQAGLPREALLITAVKDGRGDGHAVLNVRTDRGDFILDIGNNELTPWYRIGYQFLKQQSPWDQNVWVSLQIPVPVMTTANH